MFLNVLLIADWQAIARTHEDCVKENHDMPKRSGIIMTLLRDNKF
jgi:hypothetical protein